MRVSGTAARITSSNAPAHEAFIPLSFTLASCPWELFMFTHLKDSLVITEWLIY